jgi:hypothetical protein
LPPETKNVIGEEGCSALLSAFDIVANIGKDVVKIVVAASTEESGALGGDEAREAATKLANELLDDGKPLQSDIQHSEGSVSMSPHRLCRYSKTTSKSPDEAATSEIFGAHTDSTFITAGTCFSSDILYHLPHKTPLAIVPTSQLTHISFA